VTICAVRYILTGVSDERTASIFRINEANSKEDASGCLFAPEDGGSVIIRNLHGVGSSEASLAADALSDVTERAEAESSKSRSGTEGGHERADHLRLAPAFLPGLQATSREPVSGIS
jgi:hypothetical protein